MDQHPEFLYIILKGKVQQLAEEVKDKKKLVIKTLTEGKYNFIYIFVNYFFLNSIFQNVS